MREVFSQVFYYIFTVFVKKLHLNKLHISLKKISGFYRKSGLIVSKISVLWSPFEATYCASSQNPITFNSSTPNSILFFLLYLFPPSCLFPWTDGCKLCTHLSPVPKVLEPHQFCTSLLNEYARRNENP